MECISDFCNLSINDLCLLASRCGVNIVFSDTGSFVVKVRPGAVEFLRNLLQSGCDLYVLTGGRERFQTEALKAAGLFNFFKDVYGYESITGGHKLKINSKFVHVDDFPPGSDLVQAKFGMLNRLPDRRTNFVQVHSWDGVDTVDRLVSIEKKIHKLFQV